MVIYQLTCGDQFLLWACSNTSPGAPLIKLGLPLWLRRVAPVVDLPGSQRSIAIRLEVLWQRDDVSQIFDTSEPRSQPVHACR